MARSSHSAKKAGSIGQSTCQQTLHTMNTLKLNSRNRRAGRKAPAAPIKLNLGAGPTRMEGFISVDAIKFPGVDIVTDLNEDWPWEDSSVDEAHASHVLEHFGSMERVHFLNELWRVLKPGAKCTIIVPHWCSNRAYGDPTHKFPPVSEMAFYYWKKEWRLSQAPHCDSSNMKDGFTCDFEVTWGYNLHPEVASRNQEYQQHALQFDKEAAQDIIAHLTAIK